MKQRKAFCIILALILLATMLCACTSAWKNDITVQSTASITNAPNNSTQGDTTVNEYSLTRVRMSGRGDNTNGYKVAFMPSENTNGVTAYLIGYSAKTAAEVFDYLTSLSKDEIYALDKPNNRAYIINDLSYADGVGNTLNTDQKDIVSGAEFTEPGEYHFYACTLGEDGLLGIACAAQTVTVEPYANELSIKYENGEFAGTFKSYESDTILKNAVFYSEYGYVTVKAALEELSYLDMEQKVNDDCAVWYDNSVENTFAFDTSLKDIDGGAFDAGKVYYVYVASFSADKMMGISYSCEDIITPELLPTAVTSIGDGEYNGYVFPNGGASSIDNTRNSIISKSQMMFKGINTTPRIAVIGASSGSEKEIYGYFYVDEASVESYEHRFAQAGFEVVYIPLTMENYKTIGDSEYYAALIESCHGIYFTGGNQSLCARALYGENGEYNKIGQAVMNTFKKGGIIMGTSAGAHVVSSPCFQDAESYEAMYNNHAEEFDIMSYSGGAEPAAANAGNSIYYKSLDLAADAAASSAIFDSHFSARGRFGRLALILRDTDTRFGIGLDESTGMAVSGGVGTVYGSGTVTVIDTIDAQYSDGEHFGVKGLKVYSLTAGDKFIFTTSTIVPANSKTEISAPNGEIYYPSDVFDDNYATVKAFMSFAMSSEREAIFDAVPDDEHQECGKFIVTVSRKDDTKFYSTDSKFTVAALVDYNVCAYGGLTVDIEYAE